MTKERTLQAISYAKIGYTIFKLRGKHPLKGVSWSSDNYIFSEEIPTVLKDWDGNYGVALGKHHLVVDIDPRNLDPKQNALSIVCSAMGGTVKQLLEKTAVVRTGGAKPGAHIYFKKPRDLKIRKKLKELHGIDFLSKGQYVVGADCIHPETGNAYKILSSLDQIVDAPQALLDLITKPQEVKSTKEPIKEPTDNNKSIVAKYKRYLKKTDPAVEGKSGDERTFQVCCFGRDLGLSAAKTLQLVSSHFNPRCEPEWSETELERKVANAYEYATGVPGQALPESDFDEVKLENDKWRKWHFVKKGSKKLKPNFNNVENFFAMKDATLNDSLQFDEFNREIQITKKVPWHKKGVVYPTKFKSGDLLGLESWLSSEKWLDMHPRILGGVVKKIADDKKVHPLRDWLNGLEWDGKPRLSTWLLDTAGARGDEKVIKAISRVTLLQAVARALDPGCQVDTVTVLEGPQGIGKSRIVGILGGKYFDNNLNIDPKNKDTIIAMFGKWIIEMGEMVVTRQTDSAALKNFISNRTDNIRLPYAEFNEDYPRHCIFIGTVNKDGLGEYLYDPTGNRRFLPVEITLVDLKLLESIREQLFAEAVHCYRKGEDIYINDGDILRRLEKEQRKRQATDPWENAIEEHVVQERPGFLRIDYVWKMILMGSNVGMKQNDQRRIGNILRDLGYDYKNAYVGGRTQRGFIHHAYRQEEIRAEKRKKK